MRGYGGTPLFASRRMPGFLQRVCVSFASHSDVTLCSTKIANHLVFDLGKLIPLRWNDFSTEQTHFSMQLVQFLEVLYLSTTNFAR